MNAASYLGHAVTLYTDVSPGECVTRLRHDFSTARRRLPRETVSDPELAGRLSGYSFTLEFNKKRITEGIRGSNVLYRQRSFTGVLKPARSGTRIEGRYGYGVGVLIVDVILTIIAVVFGGGLLLLGLGTLITGQPQGLFAVGAGLMIVLGFYSSVKTPSDREILKERDHVSHYLRNLLGAR